MIHFNYPARQAASWLIGAWQSDRAAAMRRSALTALDQWVEGYRAPTPGLPPTTGSGGTSRDGHSLQDDGSQQATARKGRASFLPVMTDLPPSPTEQLNWAASQMRAQRSVLPRGGEVVRALDLGVSDVPPRSDSHLSNPVPGAHASPPYAPACPGLHATSASSATDRTDPSRQRGSGVLAIMGEVEQTYLNHIRPEPHTCACGGYRGKGPTARCPAAARC